MPLTGQVTAGVDSNLTKQGALSLATSSLSDAATSLQTFVDGVGDLQANKRFQDSRTLTNASSEELDMTGSLLDIYGDAINFARVKLIWIRVIKKTPGPNLIVGGAAANAFSTMFGADAHTLVVRNGNPVLLSAFDATGYVVTAGTGDLLKMLHDGSETVDLDYEIVIIGADA